MRPVLLTALFLVLSSVPAAAAAGNSAGCDGTANVNWRISRPHPWVVEAAVIDVPGCPDGQDVGLQLITDDGDVPANPLVEAVEDEQVTFDLTAYDLRVEPVTGVRVFLYGQDGEDTLEIVVDQRFFNRAGNEQVGLREMTVLHVVPGDQYDVPDVPSRYQAVTCADVGVPGGTDVVAEGHGNFVATTSGRHLACYRLRSRPGAGAGDEGAQVLGNVLERSAAVGPATAAESSQLTITGALSLPLLLAASGSLALGGLVLWVSRRRERVRPPA